MEQRRLSFLLRSHHRQSFHLGRIESATYASINLELFNETTSVRKFAAPRPTFNRFGSSGAYQDAGIGCRPCQCLGRSPHDFPAMCSQFYEDFSRCSDAQNNAVFHELNAPALYELGRDQCCNSLNAKRNCTSFASSRLLLQQVGDTALRVVVLPAPQPPRKAATPRVGSVRLASF